MDFSVTLTFWLIRAVGLGLAVLGLITWSGSSAIAGWRLFAMAAPPRLATAPVINRSYSGGIAV